MLILCGTQACAVSVFSAGTLSIEQHLRRWDVKAGELHRHLLGPLVGNALGHVGAELGGEDATAVVGRGS